MIYHFTSDTKTAAYTATDADELIPCNATTGAFIVTLMAAADVSGKVLTIKKTDNTANSVTIDGNAAETIDGTPTVVLGSQWNSRTIVSNGSEWFVLAST